MVHDLDGQLLEENQRHQSGHAVPAADAVDVSGESIFLPGRREAIPCGEYWAACGGVRAGDVVDVADSGEAGGGGGGGGALCGASAAHGSGGEHCGAGGVVVFVMDAVG